MRTACLLVVVISCAALHTATAQRTAPPVPFALGVTEHIHSTRLGEDRILNIALPQGYHPDSAARYPVVYLLDGGADEDFIHISGLFQFAAFEWIGWQRPCIVVGIANTDRKRDLTFPTTIAADKEKFPTTGGSADFMHYIAHEVMPFVDANYKTFPDRTLVGQSLGGLFAIEMLLRKPGIIQHFVIVSPSLWWDNESLLTVNDDALSAPDIGIASVYVAVGKEGKGMIGPAKKLVAKLRKTTIPRIRYQYFPDLDHANILHRAALEGLRWTGGKEVK